MSKKMTITIEVEGGNPQAVIKCNGEEYVVDGLALFAETADSKSAFTFFWNRPGPAARGVVRGISAAIQQGNDWAAQFYRAVLKGFCLATGVTVDRTNHLSTEEALERWENPNMWDDANQRNWGYQDSEDVLVDKQKSEDQRKKFH